MELHGHIVYLLAQTISSTTDDLLIITHNKFMLEQLKVALDFFLAPQPIVILEPWDCMPFENTSPSPTNTARRIESICALLARKEKKVVITNHYGFIQYLPPKSAIAQLSMNIIPERTTRKEILCFLEQAGYYGTPTANNAGEFANRASVLDVISGTYAFRINFDGDTVEKIRFLDPHSQTSSGKLSNATIYASSEIIDNALTKERLEHFLHNGARKQGIERHLPEIYGGSSHIMDYLNLPQVFSLGCDELAEDYIYNKLLAHEDALYLPHNQAKHIIEQGMERTLSLLTDSSVAPIRNFHNEASRQKISSSFAIIADDINLRQKILVAACNTVGGRSRIARALAAHEIHTNVVSDFSALPKDSGPTVHLALLPVSTGFTHKDYYFISESEFLGRQVISKSSSRQDSKRAQALLSTFNPGDIVVHEDYGIGRFSGLKGVNLSGQVRDFIAIEYAGDDRLMIPVENINLITRYGQDTGVLLDRLGGTGWQQRKARLRSKIQEIGKALVKMAAQRKTYKVDPLEIDETDFDRFCAVFPYVETEDQERAIADVKRDFVSGTLMDRLICGEAGFGKTEVAIRASYLIAAAGHQVAMLVPSTLLCAQHVATFRDRMPGLVVEQMSRLNSGKQNSDIKNRLTEGKIDILIGTHALLKGGLRFKDLRLLIIDEEQSFGVKQKEALKLVYPHIHVLSMSATPIPRTLHMSLTGVKDLSIISTPPINKADVETIISEYDERTIVNAVTREMHRKGQVFYVCPKIQQLEKSIANLILLFPKLTIIKAHGQMKPEELERAMGSFYKGECDILVSTTIVESGLNIPNANTIIIEDAHHLGISQLCQLRGRVGRHKSRGYAYVMLPKTLAQAEKTWHRINILKHVNSGFSIASHDMDTRGFGNILGQEQSGNVKEVGVELYQKMLEEAITALEKEESAHINPEINLGLAISIPKTYIEDDEARLLIYRRAAEIKTENQIEEFSAELEDRFGALPQETLNLFTTLKYKILCMQAKITKLNIRSAVACVTFYGNSFDNYDGLLSLIAKNKGALRINPNQELEIQYSQNLNILYEYIKALASLCEQQK